MLIWFFYLNPLFFSILHFFYSFVHTNMVNSVHDATFFTFIFLSIFYQRNVNVQLNRIIIDIDIDIDIIVNIINCIFVLA